MKYTYVVIPMVIISLLMPASVLAATRTTRSDSDDFGNAFQYWRRSNSKVENNIDDLDDEAVEDLPIPVLFGVAVKNLTPNFGDPRDGGTRIHEGLDIMSSEGIPVVSPTDAVVIQTGTGASSGNFVTVAAPGDESFVFMHLSKIADIDVGDELKPGDLIGFVGHTGNASADAPHLHFEIHDEDGDVTDPLPRLTKVFSIEDKIDALDDALDQADDEDALADLLVTKARADFTVAQAEDIDLPEEITAALKRNAAQVTVTGTSATSSSSVLKVGSRGSAVQTLQAFLIKKGVGSGKSITADGVFGPKTRQAVIEYQASVGLVADGVAGPKTLAYIKAHS